MKQGMTRFSLTLIFMFTCTFSVCTAGPQPSFDIKKLDIKTGMKRSVLEKNIAKYAEIKSSYSAEYSTESPENATYVIKTTNLHVIYKEGVPASYKTNKDGIITHLKAIEQTVVAWSIDE